MISVTERAADLLQEALVESGQAGSPIRLFIADLADGRPQFRLTIDPDGAQEGDVIIDKKDVRLLVDPNTAQLLEGAEIDCTDTPVGPRLIIGRPQEMDADS